MGERLSGVEALMWAAETDPMLRSDFLAVTMLDRAPEPKRMMDRLELVADAVPRLRQRVVASRIPGVTPEWGEVDGFSIAEHLATMPAPGPRPASDRRVLDLAAEIGDQPLDRTKPMWRLTIVTGLPKGRAMMVHHLDHVVSDGLGAVSLALAMLDLERDRPAGAPSDLPSPDASAGHETSPIAGSHIPTRFRDVMRAAVSQTMTVQRAVAERSLEAAVAALRDPDRAAQTVRSVRSQLLVRDPARSPLMTGRSGQRRLDILALPLDDAKAAARALGGNAERLVRHRAHRGAGPLPPCPRNAVR